MHSHGWHRRQRGLKISKQKMSEGLHSFSPQRKKKRRRSSCTSKVHCAGVHLSLYISTSILWSRAFSLFSWLTCISCSLQMRIQLVEPLWLSRSIQSAEARRVERDERKLEMPCRLRDDISCVLLKMSFHVVGILRKAAKANFLRKRTAADLSLNLKI